MFYTDLKPISPVTSDIVSYDAVSLLFGIEELNHHPERNGLKYNCYQAFRLDSGITVLIAPVGGQVDLRSYDNRRRMNWKADDLEAELLRVYPPIAEPEIVVELEIEFGRFLERRKKAQSGEEERRQQAINSLKPSAFDKAAMTAVIRVLEPDLASREKIQSALEEAANDPASFLLNKGAIERMSVAMCEAYSWRSEFFEGQIWERARIASVDWKADRVDLIYAIERLAGLTLPDWGIEEANIADILKKVGRYLRRSNKVLIEYQTNTDDHCMSIIDKKDVETFEAAMLTLGIQLINHSKRRLFW